MTPSLGTRLPTGTVTFLFTDIEGSTAMLVELGDAYEPLLAAHARLLREAFGIHGGIEVNTEGDAFFVVFPSAVEAVAAVTAGQSALATERWPDGAQLRVRMGLHSGEGRLGGDDYAGLDVNRAARIAAAAHGGQVIMSDATRALAASDLPAGVTFRDLGRHRLKDLPDPEHIWQLVIDGLPADFPTLRTLDARPTNLPLAPTSLVGREHDLATLRGLLEAKRLVTLTGPGGTGKTRLAISIAASLLDDFPDGVFFVGLQDARDRAAIVSEIADVLGVREGPRRDPHEAVASYLRDREVLLVLDNLEQVVADAPVVGELLRESPGLRVVATSREALRIAGEQEYAVPSLGVPEAVDASPDTLASIASVALFVDRAREARADFRLSDQNAAAVAGICRRLDGLPLALELAAARIRLLSPESILARLEKALPLLAGGARDRPARQQTLRGAIDWSHELLDGPERQLFARLSVFAGGWTLEAAERVCGQGVGAAAEVFDGLSSLVDKSLVRTDHDDRGDPRFSMLQVIREYALDRLAEDPGAREIGRRHAAWMADLAEQAEPQLIGADLRDWQERIRNEDENLRTALRWALGSADAATALRIAGSLWRFWHYWGAVREGADWLERVLAMPATDVPTEAYARALTGLAGLRYWQGRADAAEALYEEALQLRRQLGDEKAIADALSDTYWTALARGEVDLAFQRGYEALEHYRSAGDEAGAAATVAWKTIGEFVTDMGGSYEAAAATTEQAADLLEQVGRSHDASEFRASTAYVHWIARQHEASYEALRRALRALHQLGHVGRLGGMLKMAAALELALGRPGRAVVLASAAARHADELGGEVGGGLLQVGDPLEEAKEQLAAEEYAAAVLQGRSMSLEEAVACALEEDRT